MENENWKEVLFVVYCPKCKHAFKSSSDEPCDECLATGGRLNSHKPVMFEEG